MRRWLLLAGLLALGACGEPATDVTIPERNPGQHVLDQAGILDTEALERRLAKAEDKGVDIVALTYETSSANCGEAFRAAREFVQTWQADVALIAVARRGDFTSDDPKRQRCVGVQPVDTRAVSGALRERIAEELIPPKALANDWTGAFTVAADALVRQ